MNSSLAPPGPRVRNSLMTIGRAGVGDTEGDGDGLGSGDGVGVGDGEGAGDGDGLGTGSVTVKVAGTDSTARADARICATPGPIPVANPACVTVAMKVSVERQLKITPPTSW